MLQYRFDCRERGKIMASIGTNTMISQMRERKRLRQTQLWHLTELSAVTLSRFDNNHQSPYLNTFDNLMSSMKLPVDTFFCPYLEDVTTDILVLRDKLLHELEWAADDPMALDKAKDILGRFNNMKNFHAGINRQFVISCSASIGIIEGMIPADIISLVKDGIAITYPEYDPNTFEGDMLLFEEPNLIHNQALAYAKSGDSSTAVTLLNRIATGLTRLPQDDRDKERMLAPILLSLSRLLTEAGEHDQALETCEAGNKVSLRRNKGKYTPDFMYMKVQLLQHLGRQSEIKDLLKPIYFGFIAMGRQKRAKEILAFAKDINMELETYGAENLLSQRPEAVFERGEPVTCNSVGELIFKLREAANISQGELCKGICSVSTLSKIESGATKQGSVYHLEAFMQRLGRNIDYYFNTFLSNDDFKEKQMRDEVRTRQVNRQFDDAENLLKELEKKKAYQRGVNQQFVKLSKAGIYSNRNSYDATHKEMLMDAWRITRKDKDIDDITAIRLTNYELLLLNSIAINLCANGQINKGLRIFEDLQNNIKHFYVDGTEKMRTYPLVSYNYSKNLGSVDQYCKILDISDEGLNLCIQYGDLRRIAGLAVNKAYALFELGQDEKSVPYFAIAHYVSGLFSRVENQRRARKYAEERLGIVFS